MPTIANPEPISGKQGFSSKLSWKKKATVSLEKYRTARNGILAAAVITIAGLIVLFLLGGVIRAQAFYLAFPPWMALALALCSALAIHFCARSDKMLLAIYAGSVAVVTVVISILFTTMGLMAQRMKVSIYSVINDFELAKWCGWVAHFLSVSFTKQPMYIVLYAAAIYLGFWFAVGHERNIEE